MMKQRPINQGFALVEVIVASTIILIFTISLSGAYSLYIRTAFENLHKVQAAFLSEEGIEAVKLLRDSSWSSNILPLSSTTPYYLTYSSGTWKATTTKTLIDGVFDRSVVIGETQRDSGSNIVDSGGTVDPNTRSVKVSVSWFGHGATTTKTISAYITNLFVN